MDQDLQGRGLACADHTQTTPPTPSLVDIDTIEIRSEDEEQDAVTAIKPRRTYNYRVCGSVMGEVHSYVPIL